MAPSGKVLRRGAQASVYAPRHNAPEQRDGGHGAAASATCASLREDCQEPAGKRGDNRWCEWENRTKAAAVVWDSLSQLSEGALLKNSKGRAL